MKKKLLWAAAILLTALLYFFDNQAGTLLLLAGTVLLPLLSFLPALFGRKALQFSLELPQALQKKEEGEGTLCIKNKGFLPLQGRTLLHFENLRTGEKTQQEISFFLLPRGKKTLKFQLTCPYCGRVEVSAHETRLGDLFGILSLAAEGSAAGGLSVLPTLFEPEIRAGASDSASPDSDRYSTAKPGYDPGETFDLREYIPGDSLKSIHWKLSSKLDRLMVREFGLPVVQDYLLLLETAGGTPAQRDAATEVFASVAQALTALEMAPKAAWPKGPGDELEVWDLQNSDDFAAMLEALLRAEPTEGSVAERLYAREPHCGFSHVMVVSVPGVRGIRNLCNGNRVTLIRCAAVDEGQRSDGIFVRSFAPETCTADLSVLEV